MADKLANLEQATYSPMYTDGSGNLIYALPRWNQAPNVNEDSFSASEDKVLALDLLTESDDLAELSELLDFKDFFHGREYVMSDFGIVSRRIYKTEEGKFDRVFAQATQDLGLFGDIGENFKAYVGQLGGAIGSEGFQALFGDRQHTISQAYPLDFTAINQQELLAHIASHVKMVMNFRPNTLDISYKMPRPVELGKTVLLPDNMWLYYVTGITRSWEIGQQYVESYHCEYGHPLWTILPIPWMTRINDAVNSTLRLREEANKNSVAPSSTGNIPPLVGKNSFSTRK